jgi:hypothetical protein
VEYHRRIVYGGACVGGNMGEAQWLTHMQSGALFTLRTLHTFKEVGRGKF